MQVANEINKALLSSLRLKAKILAIFLISIVGVQVTVIGYLLLRTDAFQVYFPLGKAIAGPVLILTVALLELFAVKYFRRAAETGLQISARFNYLLSFAEISFPTLLLIFAATFINDQKLFVVPAFLLNSPPGLIYFVLIILSAFTLNYRLCVFSGLVAGIEYIVFSVVFLSLHNAAASEFPNNIVKGVLMMVCGIITGLVSKKIREAVETSLQAKNDLINRLDTLVGQKTAEIESQKEKLIEKNREITDSIHYASRIQKALLPTQKYFSRQLERLKR